MYEAYRPSRQKERPLRRRLLGMLALFGAGVAAGVVLTVQVVGADDDQERAKDPVRLAEAPAAVIEPEIEPEIEIDPGFSQDEVDAAVAAGIADALSDAQEQAALDQEAAVAAATEEVRSAERARAEKKKQKAVQKAVDKALAEAEDKAPVGFTTPPAKDDTDPRFSYCYEAVAAGYGDYVRGVDPEYDWYRDSDGDGVVCER